MRFRFLFESPDGTAASIATDVPHGADLNAVMRGLWEGEAEYETLDVYVQTVPRYYVLAKEGVRG